MTEIESKINDILEKWNPLGVPAFIAEYEYEAYIPDILNYISDEKKLEVYLIDLLKNKMGLDIKDVSEIKEVSKKFIKIGSSN